MDKAAVSDEHLTCKTLPTLVGCMEGAWWTFNLQIDDSPACNNCTYIGWWNAEGLGLRMYGNSELRLYGNSELRSETPNVWGSEIRMCRTQKMWSLNCIVPESRNSESICLRYCVARMRPMCCVAQKRPQEWIQPPKRGNTLRNHV